MENIQSPEKKKLMFSKIFCVYIYVYIKVASDSDRFQSFYF